MNEDNVFKPFPTLETERTILRQLTMNDAEAIFNYASREEVARFVTWEAHETLDDSKNFIHYALERYANYLFAPWGIVLKENNELIGTADFVSWEKRHRTAEIGYVLSSDYWGQGLMPEVAKKIVAFGFEKMNLVRIQALCLEENVASEKVMQKIGMTYEGTYRKKMFIKGEHQNIKVYAIVK